MKLGGGGCCCCGDGDGEREATFLRLDMRSVRPVTLHRPPPFTLNLLTAGCNTTPTAY
jgi:hypothetical protein